MWVLGVLPPGSSGSASSLASRVSRVSPWVSVGSKEEHTKSVALWGPPCVHPTCCSQLVAGALWLSDAQE